MMTVPENVVKSGWIAGLPLLAAIILSCAPDPPVVVSAGDDAGTGPILVRSAGSRVHLGDSSAWAQANEQPRGWVVFGYDFQLDRTEVTQAEFVELMGWNPSSPGAGSGDSFPVQNLSWFDAVLFCNARSVRDGLDTVYAYSARRRNANGVTWDLQSLSADLGKSGWRLPTESEWEFAARAGGTSTWPWGEVADSGLADAFAWYKSNSGGKTHPVGTRRPNAWGFLDMTGNVMEWMQDWAGPHPDSAKDFAGLVEPGPMGDKPIKGGSFEYGLRYLRPASRSATYASLPGATAEYVGFRCAKGAIGSPEFASREGGILQGFPGLRWEPSVIASRIGFRSAKLAFVQVYQGNRALSWIDFGTPSPVLRAFSGDGKVYHPAISPDGQWVAWSNAVEGLQGDGKIRLRRLVPGDSSIVEWTGNGAIPRWWVRPATRDTFLVVAGTAMDDGIEGWERQVTHLLGFSAGKIVSDSILAGGAFHDGRSADGRYLATGYTRLKRLDMNDGTVTTGFTGPGNGKASGDTSQMCNVSIAPDSSGDVLGLDFGYSSKSSIVGRPYGIHEVAFRIGVDGKIKSHFVVPSEAVQWEDLEWTNDPDLAVATTLDASGLRGAVRLLDLEDGSSDVLVEGHDLWQPSLWIEAPNPWIEAIGDSAGAYNTPAADISQEELANKLVRFWPLRDSIEVAALGSSRTRFGFAPASISSWKAFNFGAAGGPMDLSDSLLIHYLLPHSPRLRFVVLELDPGWLAWRVCDGLCGFFEKSDGRAFDRNHNDWVDSLPARILSRIVKQSWNSSGEFDRWGQGTSSPFGWGADVSNDWSYFIKFDLDTSWVTYRRNLAGLERTLALLSRSGVDVLGVLYPQSPLYAESEWAGRHEPRWDLYRQIVSDLERIASDHGNFRIYDANMDGAHDYRDEDAMDYDHLSAVGAAKFSARIDSVLVEWKSNAP